MKKRFFDFILLELNPFRVYLLLTSQTITALSSPVEIKRSLFPDLRSTLYWNGNILTNENGKATIRFFTSDATTPYTIILTGVTTSGAILYKAISVNAYKSLN